MIDTVISLALLGVLVLFLLAGMLWGLKRGLKKTLFRAGWLIVTAVLLIVFTPMVTRSLLNADLSSLNLVVNGKPVSTLQNMLITLFSQDPDLGQIAAENPDAVSTLVQISTLIVNLVIFVGLFWVLKIILWPIWAILSAVLIRKRRPDGTKKPQHRLLGMAVGAILGLVVCMFTLTPFTGSAAFALQVEEQTKGLALAAQVAGGQADPDRGLLSQAMGEESASYLKKYQEGIGLKVYRYTGLEALSGWIFQSLTTQKINGVKVSLTDGALTALSVAERGLELTNLSFEDLTKEEFDELLAELRTLNQDLFSVGILEAVGNDLMPYVITKLANGELGALPDLQSPELNDALKKTLNGLKNLTFSDLKGEIDRVLDIAELLNDKDILTQCVKPDVNFQVLAEKMDQEMISSLTEALFNMKIITVAFPAFLDAGVDYAIENLGGTLPAEQPGSPSVEQMKSFLTELLTDGVQLYQSLDLDSEYYVTQPSLALAGSMLDTIRAFPGIGAERYASLVNAFEIKIKDALDQSITDQEMSGIVQELKNLVDGLSEADHFEADFAVLGEKFEDFVAFVDAAREQPPQIKLAELGSVLDGFAATDLFGGSVTNLLSAGLDYAKTALPEAFSGLAQNLDNMKSRLSEVRSWESEFDSYMGLFEVIQEVGGESFDSGTLFDEDNDLLNRFGKALDQAGSSVLLEPELPSVFSVLLDQAETSLGESALAAAMLDEIRDNLSSGQNFNWEAEFAAVKRLGSEFVNLSGELTEETALSVGAALDEVVLGNTQLLSRTSVNELICVALDELVANVPEDVDISGVTDSLKQAVRSTPDLGYERELGALFTLFDEVKNLDATSLETLNLAGLGEMLDSFDQTAGSRPSVLVSAVRPELVNTLLDTVSDKTQNEQIKDILTEISLNVDNIQSYQAEFGYLQTFVDQIGSMTDLDGSDQTALTGFGRTLDGLAASRLLAGYGAESPLDVRQSIMEMILDQVLENQADPDIKDLLRDMKGAVPSVLSYETEFSAINHFVNLVEDLQAADMDTFSLASFGAALDGYSDFEGRGRAFLICAARENVVTLAVDKIHLDVTDTDIPQEAVDEILQNTKTCAQLAEAGQLTYATLFGDLDILRQKVQTPPEIVIERDSADVTALGVYLDELQALSVVPVKSVLRISKSLLSAVAEATAGVEGVDDARVQEARQALNDEISRLDAAYDAALAQEQPAKRNFQADYASVTQKLSDLMQAINSLFPVAP